MARLPWYFGAIFGFAGLLVVTIGWWMVAVQHHRLVSYVPVRARILESRVEASKGSKGSTTYAPIIRYSYEVDGKRYQSDRVAAVGKFSSSGPWASRMQAAYRVGHEATAWRSLDDPGSAFLSRDVESFPHILALFGLPFLIIGIWASFITIHGSRAPAPPVARRDGWFELREQGTTSGRFRFWAVVTLAWCAWFAAVVGDYWMLNAHRFDLFSWIIAGIGGAGAIVGVVLTRRYWRLGRDFLAAELCANSDSFQLGRPVEFRLRQSLGRGLRIQEVAIGAVCMRSDRIKTGSSVNYPPASEVSSCWKTVELGRIYAPGAEVAATAALLLPPAAAASTPPRSRDYPIFQWFIVLRVQAEGEPQLTVRFPVIVESCAAPVADIADKSELISRP